jgi:hypothetical protein
MPKLDKTGLIMTISQSNGLFYSVLLSNGTKKSLPTTKKNMHVAQLSKLYISLINKMSETNEQQLKQKNCRVAFQHSYNKIFNSCKHSYIKQCLKVF